MTDRKWTSTSERRYLLTDICRAIVRLDGLDCARLCRIVYLRRCQRHPLYLVTVRALHCSWFNLVSNNWQCFSLFYAGAEQKQMPEILAMIQVNHLTPTPAVIFMCALSLIYLASKDIYALINYVGFATWLAIGLGVACLPYLRWKRPDLARPIKVNLIWPTIYIAASIFITIVPMLADPKGTGMGVLIILTGVPVYVVFIGWKNKPRFLQNAIGKLIGDLLSSTFNRFSLCRRTYAVSAESYGRRSSWKNTVVIDRLVQLDDLRETSSFWPRLLQNWPNLALKLSLLFRANYLFSLLSSFWLFNFFKLTLSLSHPLLVLSYTFVLFQCFFSPF